MGPLRLPRAGDQAGHAVEMRQPGRGRGASSESRYPCAQGTRMPRLVARARQGRTRSSTILRPDSVISLVSADGGVGRRVHMSCPHSENGCPTRQSDLGALLLLSATTLSSSLVNGPLGRRTLREMRIPRCISVMFVMGVLFATACGGSETQAPTAAPSPTRRVTVEVPSLEGLQEAEAVSVLERAGLAYVVRREQAPPGTSSGAVLGSDPTGGTRVETFRVVIVRVAAAVEPSATPTPPSARKSPVSAPIPEDPEAFLDEFAVAWGRQDRARLSQLATRAAVKQALTTGPGEASVLWGDCPMGSSGSGGCEALFMPKSQTECCAQIWVITYGERREAPGHALIVFELRFEGDAG